MKRFILKDGPDKNGRVRLTGADYRHLVKARRLAPGEYFPALLPCGNEISENEILLKVCSVDKDSLVCEVAGSVTPVTPAPPVSNLPEIILFQAMPKGDKMDLIVRQAAECGVLEIVPFVSEFSIGKTVGKQVAVGQKFSRWERIVREARQQSGSAVQTAVPEPVSFDGLLAYWERLKKERPGVLGLLFHHLPLENEPLHGYLGKSAPEAVVLVIGPEGGFSPVETERFLTAGFKPFTFAGAILRTETAALYAAAAVQILLTERESWETK